MRHRGVGHNPTQQTGGRVVRAEGVRRSDEPSRLKPGRRGDKGGCVGIDAEEDPPVCRALQLFVGESRR